MPTETTSLTKEDLLTKLFSNRTVAKWILKGYLIYIQTKYNIPIGYRIYITSANQCSCRQHRQCFYVINHPKLNFNMTTYPLAAPRFRASGITKCPIRSYIKIPSDNSPHIIPPEKCTTEDLERLLETLEYAGIE